MWAVSVVDSSESGVRSRNASLSNFVFRLERAERAERSSIGDVKNEKMSGRREDLKNARLEVVLTMLQASPYLAQQQGVAAKAFHAFNNAVPNSPLPSSSPGAMLPTLQQQQKSNLLGALNGGGATLGERNANSLNLLAALNSHPHSPAPPSPSTPTSSAAQLDPWASGQSSSHLPLSISQSINNPGLPSGVIVSAQSVNGMAMHHSSLPSRAETPNPLPPVQIHQGGKLLLGSAHPATSSLIQPGSVPGSGQSENEKVYYLIVDLMSPTTREGALLELSKKREQWDDLALVLWHSFGQSCRCLPRSS